MLGFFAAVRLGRFETAGQFVYACPCTPNNEFFAAELKGNPFVSPELQTLTELFRDRRLPFSGDRRERHGKEVIQFLTQEYFLRKAKRITFPAEAATSDRTVERFEGSRPEAESVIADWFQFSLSGMGQPDSLRNSRCRRFQGARHCVNQRAQRGFVSADDGRASAR